MPTRTSRRKPFGITGLAGWMLLTASCAFYGGRIPYAPAPAYQAEAERAPGTRNQPFHTEAYDRIVENPFLAVKENPLSTFSIDVDTASYSNMRRFLTDGQRPPADAVRIEELINYFSYDYPLPRGEEPFSVTAEVAACPWNNDHKLVHIGLKGRPLDQDNLPPRNLVFLMDVSGSMSDSRKLPLLKSAGDFNVGTTSQGELIRLIEKERESGVFLTVLGFGTGNLKDSTMEKLADKGNGNYAYIDTLNEARKVLVHESGATLVTIAKDVKIQVEFNPARVSAYRLIGYENQLLRTEDFHDDSKDAGEIGAGHTVTALYEVVPADVQVGTGRVDALKYQSERTFTGAAGSNELLTLKLRYKAPSAAESKLITGTVDDRGDGVEGASANYRFSAAVAAFGMLLRDSNYKGAASYDLVVDLARNALGPDPHGNRKEFLTLVDKARRLGD